MMWWPYGTAMGWWMMAWIVVFGGGLIALIVLGIKKLTERDDSATKHSAIDIAKERYARGEITREDFEQIKKDLS